MTVPLIGYDSSRPEMIPDNPAAIFPYADGKFAWSHKMFHNVPYRYITIHGDIHADIADYEQGAIFGREPLLAWARGRMSRYPDADLTIYTDRANFPAVFGIMSDTPWHLFLSVGTDPIVTEYQGMHVRACQEFGIGYDIDHVFDDGWLNRP
jgi:hypothetical protein